MEWLFSAAALWWIAAVSLAMFLGTLLLMPWLALRMPADYFVREEAASPRPRTLLGQVGRVSILVLCNLLGIIFLVMGFIMLFTPGQGVLTMIIGLLLMSFPGKKRLVLKLISRPRILAAINALRARYNKAPLEIPASPNGR
jgi:hypothetical protein